MLNSTIQDYSQLAIWILLDRLLGLIHQSDHAEVQTENRIRLYKISKSLIAMVWKFISCQKRKIKLHERIEELFWLFNIQNNRNN